MPEITLFGSRQSPFVEKTVRGLQLKGLEFELVEPKRPTDIGKWNPITRKMPVADIHGERVYDSTFILRKLEELKPEPPLLSGDPTTAAKQRQLEDWADEALYWYAMAVLFSEPHADRTASDILGDAVPGFLKPLLTSIVK